MSSHSATITWSRATPDFSYDTYDRSHTVGYESGTVVTASSAPDFKGDATKVNPEEALVGALSSCHMLTFLAVAARKRLVVDAYVDTAVGYLEKNDEGRLAITRIVLRPAVRFAEGTTVDAAALADLHVKAHAGCFIGNSIKAAVTVESV